MAVLQTQRYCHTCGRNTLHARSRFGLEWGCLLSTVTLGLFLPVWLVLGVLDAFKPWRCQVCGGGKML